MKHFLFTCTVALILLSCGSRENKSDTESTTEIGGVENVNGNIPDTNALGATPNTDNSLGRIDSTYADTAGKSTKANP